MKSRAAPTTPRLGGISKVKFSRLIPLGSWGMLLIVKVVGEEVEEAVAKVWLGEGGDDSTPELPMVPVTETLVAGEGGMS